MRGPTSETPSKVRTSGASDIRKKNERFIVADVAKWLMRRTCNAKVPSSSLGIGFHIHISI